MNAYQEFVYNADEHDTSAKTFSFPIYSNGSRTIPERSESEGMQDGIDLITALAIHPETARRLARKFWHFFVSEIHPPDPSLRREHGRRLPAEPHRDQAGRAVHPHLIVVQRSVDALRALFLAGGIRRARDQGGGLAEPLARQAAIAAGQHGQLLFEPPNVGGWPLGAGWFSTGTMLARTNFAATLAASQKEFLRAALEPEGGTPQALLAAMLDRVTPAPLDAAPQQALMSYLLGGGRLDRQRRSSSTRRAAGLARLLVGSSEYQLV